MSSYFSNHSQSRFLANASPKESSPAGTVLNPSQSNNSTAPGPGGGRSRAPSSKHFSTSVLSVDDKSTAKSSGNAPGTVGIGVGAGGSTNGSSSKIHPLRNTWVFWFRQQRAPGNKITNYEEGIKKISAFSSVETFWSLWTHLEPPSSLLPTTDYLLFHSGVRRPVWEDPLNITGGKWIIRIKKGVADRLWEDLVLAIIGDQFDESPTVPPLSHSRSRGSTDDESTGEDGLEWPGICGCTISVREREDIISIWNRYEADQKVRDRIRDTIRKALNLPPSTIMEYKTNNDSMQDKSSFRTTPIDRS